MKIRILVRMVGVFIGMGVLIGIEALINKNTCEEGHILEGGHYFKIMIIMVLLASPLHM